MVANFVLVSIFPEGAFAERGYVSITFYIRMQLVECSAYKMYQRLSFRFYVDLMLWEKHGLREPHSRALEKWCHSRIVFRCKQFNALRCHWPPWNQTYDVTSIVRGLSVGSTSLSYT